MTALTADMIASLVYLSILLVAVGSWVFMSSAEKPPAGKMIQQALIWLSVFVAVIAGYGLWQDVNRALMPRQAVFSEGASVAIPRDRDGHFYLTLDINNVPVSFVVDTGATDMVLSPRDAARIGLSPDTLIFSGRAFTANGSVATARVTLTSVALDGVVDRDVSAVVNGSALDTSLLGMRYLERWSSMMIDGDRMVLMR